MLQFNHKLLKIQFIRIPGGIGLKYLQGIFVLVKEEDFILSLTIL